MAEATDERLLRGIERIERMMEARTDINHDIRDVYAELKADGYDGGMVRRLIGRRAMDPAARAEADQMLAVYEAAIGMGDSDAADLPTIAELRPDAAALAAAMLAGEIVMLEDPAQARALVEHMLCLLDLRAEVALLRAQEADRRKLAKAEGFEPKQMGQAVRWFEKCAKHGVEAMRAGEAVFQLYRGTFEQRDADATGPVTGDAKLAGLFTPAKPDKAVTAKQKQVGDAVALAAISRMNRGMK